AAVAARSELQVAARECARQVADAFGAQLQIHFDTGGVTGVLGNPYLTQRQAGRRIAHPNLDACVLPQPERGGVDRLFVGDALAHELVSRLVGAQDELARLEARQRELPGRIRAIARTRTR